MATQKDFRIKNGLIVQNGNTTVDQGTVSISDQISGDTGQLIITNGQSGDSFMRIGMIGSGTANSHIRTDSTLEFHIGQSATSATPSVSIDTSGNTAFAGTISSGSQTITSDAYTKIYSSTNGSSTGLRFSDHVGGSYAQYGDIRYYHADSSSYGSGNAFVFTSSESTTTILADGKLMFKEGLYVKPLIGTGAGTQIIDPSRNVIPYQIKGSGGDDTPAGTQFSNVIKAQGTNRTIYFDGANNSVSTWYGVGNNPYAAIDCTDGVLDIWVNDSNGTWKNVIDFSNTGASLAGELSITTFTNNYLRINGNGNHEAMTRYKNSTANYWYTGIRTTNGIASTLDYHIYSTALGDDAFALTTSGDLVAKRNLNTKTGDIQINGQTVISAARNITAGTINSGVITSGDSSTSGNVRSYFSDGTYTDLKGYGLEFNRATSYIRPTTDGTKTLNIGGSDASTDWNRVQFRSVNGLYMTGTQFLTTDRNLVNIGTINSGAIDVTGTVTSDGLTVQTSQGDIAIANSASSLNFARAGTNYIRATNAVGHFKFITGANDFATQRLNIAANGDISFYDDTGTSQNLKWDASADTLNFVDNAKAAFGNGNDLKLYHTGLHSYIDENGTGNLYIGSNNGAGVYIQGSGETLASFVDDGAVTLYHNNSPKLATVTGGVNITGQLTADGLSTSSGTALVGEGASGGSTQLIYWNGTNAYYGRSNLGGSVTAHEFRSGGLTRLTVNSTGIDVTGTVTSDGLTSLGATYSKIESITAPTLNTDTHAGEALWLRSGGTSGVNNVQAVLGFGKADGGSKRTGAAIASVQTEADADKVGIELYRSWSSASSQTMTKGFTLASNGDISFYEDTGTNAKFFWDASAEALGIGDTSPNAKLTVQGDVLARDEFRGEVVSYAANQDAPYLIAGTSGYTGATTNWNTHGFQHRIKSNANGVPRITIDTSNGEAFTVTNNNRVGIGTSSPSVPLHIETLSTSGTGTPTEVLRLQVTEAPEISDLVAGDGTKLSFYVPEGNQTTQEGAAIAALRESSSDVNAATSLAFYTAGDDSSVSRAMTVDSPGNVLVGKTSASLGTPGVELKPDGIVRSTRAGYVAEFNRITNDGEIVNFKSSGLPVGSIAYSSGNFRLDGDGLGLHLNGSLNVIYPSNGSGSLNNGVVDLGYSSSRFKNLYLAGAANVNSINSVSSITAGQALNVNAAGASDTRIEVGAGTTANHYAYIDLVTDTTYTDYGLRILRDNGGANASSTIGHRGTGNLNIVAYEAASIRLNTGGQNALTLNSSQNATFAGELLLGNSNTKLSKADTNSNRLKIQTNSGYTEIGAGNTGWSHFYTDREKYYFNRRIIVDEGIISSYDEDLVLQRAFSTVATFTTTGATFAGNIIKSGGTDAQFLKADGSVQSTSASSPQGTLIPFNETSEEISFLINVSHLDGLITGSQTATLDLSTGEIEISSQGELNIKANSIEANKIASNTITANEIASGTITASEIASSTITGTQINTDLLNVKSFDNVSSTIVSHVTAGTKFPLAKEGQAYVQRSGTYTGSNASFVPVTITQVRDNAGYVAIFSGVLGNVSGGRVQYSLNNSTWVNANGNTNIYWNAGTYRGYTYVYTGQITTLSSQQSTVYWRVYFSGSYNHTQLSLNVMMDNTR